MRLLEPFGERIVEVEFAVKKFAIACWVIQGIILFGLIFIEKKPLIPEDVAALGFPFILLYLLPQFLFLLLGCVCFAIYKRRNGR